MTGGRPSSQPTDSVFIVAAAFSAEGDQQERLWLLAKRGRKVLLIAAGVTFLAVLAVTVRTASIASSWWIPLAALTLAVGCDLVDRRFSHRPPGSVEVPADLGDLLEEMYQVRDEVVIYGPDQFRPLHYKRAVELVDGHVNAMVAEAAQALAAGRQGDDEANRKLRASIDNRLEAVMDVYEVLDGDGDWLDGDDQDDDDDHDEDSVAGTDDEAAETVDQDGGRRAGVGGRRPDVRGGRPIRPGAPYRRESEG